MNRRTFALGAAATFALTSGDAFAQRKSRNHTFEAPESGVVISLGSSGDAHFLPDEYVFGEYRHYSQEEIWFELEDSWNAVHIIKGNVTPKLWNNQNYTMIANYYDSWGEILGDGTDDDSAWFLTNATYYLNLQEMIYTELYMDIGDGTTVAVAIWAHPSTLIERATWVQENVTVNGYSVFGDTDFGEIEQIKDGKADIAPVPIDFAESRIEDWEDDGLISDSKWESAHHNIVATWNTDVWNVPLKHPNPVGSNLEEKWSQVYMENNDRSGRSSIDVSTERLNLTIEGYVRRWTTEEFLTQIEVSSPALASTNDDYQGSIIVLSERRYGEVTIMIREAYLTPDGGLVMLSVQAAPEYLPGVYADWIDFIEINGEPIQPSWTQSDLELITADYIRD